MRTTSIDSGEQSFFATCAKGVEDVLSAELQHLGISVSSQGKGGVYFCGDLESCYRANLWSRSANRIMVPLAVFSCVTPNEFYTGVRGIVWREFLTPEMTLAVSCNLRDSFTSHSGWAALKAKDAIVDAIRDAYGRRPSVNPRQPDLQIHVHLVNNQCTVSLDSSGRSLNQRGYRADSREAPLRETLAAAIIDLSGWDGASPLLDPMCGSGTLPIEAAMKAAARAPGLLGAGFGFQQWRGFNSQLWERLQEEARDVALDQLPAPIFGTDISAQAVSAARRNAVRAGVNRMALFATQDICALAPPPGPGTIIINPPYGERLGELEQLRPLYRQIGDVLKQRCTGYTAYLFTGNLELAKSVGLKATRRIVLYNGPIECRLLRYELY